MAAVTGALLGTADDSARGRRAHRGQGRGQSVLRRGGDALAARGRHAAPRERPRRPRARAERDRGARQHPGRADRAARPARRRRAAGDPGRLRHRPGVRAPPARAHHGGRRGRPGARRGAARARADLREGRASRAGLHVQARAHARRRVRERARERRRELHRTIGLAIEELYADRLAEFYETLAHHFERAEEWERALDYHERAAAKAADSFANLAVIAHCRQALAIADRLGAAVPPPAAGALEEQLGAGLLLRERVPRVRRRLRARRGARARPGARGVVLGAVD